MRLDALDPARMNDEQRELDRRYRKQIANGFTAFRSQDGDGRLIGPWGVWLHQPAVGRVMADMTEAVSAMTALPRRAKEIVILVMGARFGAAYELYAHTALAEEAGLSRPQIAALSTGQRPEGLNPEEGLAFDATGALVQGGVLPGFLYAALRDSFGEAGLAELVTLAGMYAMVSILLNAYDVQAPETRAGG